MIRRRICSAAENVAAFVLGAALVASLVPAALSAQEVELRWKFEPGADRVYRLVQSSRSTTTMGEISQTQTFTLRHQVLDVADDGAADVRVTYESMRLVQDGPMVHREFDSESDEPPGDPMAMMLSKLVGVSFDMTAAPDGEVRRVAGMENMVEAIAAGVDGVGPETAAPMRAVVDDMFTEEAMQSMMQQSMQTLPDGPIAAGATWSHASSLEFPFGTLRSDTDYTLEGVVTEQGRRIARIAMRGTRGELEPNPDNPMPAAMEMSGGEVTGEIDFDVERGLVLRSTFVTNMDMSAAGQSTHVESNVEMTLVEGS